MPTHAFHFKRTTYEIHSLESSEFEREAAGIPKVTNTTVVSLVQSPAF